MTDIESALTPQAEDMSASVRRRRNASSTVESANNETSAKMRLSSNQRLVQQINSHVDEDDEFKKAMIKERMASNNQMVHAQVQTVVFLFGLLALLYLYLSFGESDPQKMSSLTKALRILLGFNNHKNHDGLPRGKKLVASTTIDESSLDEFKYPSWPWASSSSYSNYLVPGTEEGRRIQNMLHRTSKFKAKKLDVELYGTNEMISFLESEKGQMCNIAGENTIRIQYDLFGEIGMAQIQKMLWAWCSLYTGEAYGFLDLDSYEIDMKELFINYLSRGRIQNAIIDIGSIKTDTLNTQVEKVSLASSMIFIGNRQSAVAKAMLEHMMSVDINNLPYNLIEESLNQIIPSIQQEKDLWTVLNANCLSNKSRSRLQLANICQGQECCEVTMPEKTEQ